MFGEKKMFTYFNAQRLSCVAAGYLPLVQNTNNPGVVSLIGVKCEAVLGYAGTRLQNLIHL